MSTDAHFLAAVAAAPADDRLPRLVYADWLDDHDDPRGELIRLEEECRGRVAWDETLWRLKPRRNELRGRTDPAWLTAMGYGTDCEPLFRGEPFPAGWRDGWRLIREAHERWTGDPMPDVGGRRSEVEAAERRLGMTLPPSVREYVAFALDLRDGGRDEPNILSPLPGSPALSPVPGLPVLSLIFDFSDEEHRAIRHEDLRHDDPPVHTYRWDTGGVYVRLEDRRYPSVSRFVFWSACERCSGRHGSMSVGVRNVGQLRSRLCEAFPLRAVFDGVERYEATNLHAELRVPGYYDAGHLDVYASRAVGREQVPEFLWEFCCSGGGSGGFGGIFADEHQRVYRPSVGGDDIPF
jgi:uncharacterized protein (TIGR02996 family)